MRLLTLVCLILPSFLISQETGEYFYSSDDPMGNIAVTKAPGNPMQYFFTIHPESKPDGNKVFELKGGKAVPFPDSIFQEQFISPLGIYLDKQHRLWILDHGNYALKTARLYAFDASSGTLLINHTFQKDIVRKWVMLNDLSVTPDGNYVIISAPGMFKKRSSIVVFDVSEQSAQRLLTDHPSVMRKKILPEVDGIKMKFFLGLLKVRPGVDGIDVDPWGKYLYFAAMADTILYRLPVDAITDPQLDDEALSKLIQSIGNRPLCDGIRVDEKKLVYLTDFQNHQILAMDPQGDLSVVLKNEKIRWADGLSVGADGYLYITDSALQYVIQKSSRKYDQHKPFGIWRIKIAP